MKIRINRPTLGVALTAMLLGLPLAGAALTGRPLSRYAVFPPLGRDLPQAPFAWPVFWALLLLGAAVLAPFVRRLCSARPTPQPTHRTRTLQPFPWWGWLGVALGAGFWTLAWTRFAWFAPLQRHTFTPLWLAYVLVINALAFRRQGHCLLTARTGRYLGLFPASALFWWLFEYLNRFVQNWHYEGVAGMRSGEYILFATAAFATVLPAVAATAEWLATFRAFTDERLTHLAHLPSTGNRAALAMLTLSAFSVAALPVWPNLLFPLVWLAPLTLLLALQRLAGERTILDDLQCSDWRLVTRYALAALVCGFWWELWNLHSLAKWKYTVPFLQRFLVFEMPAPGFLGYLPFGVECAAIVAWLAPSWTSRPVTGRGGPAAL